MVVYQGPLLMESLKNIDKQYDAMVNRANIKETDLAVAWDCVCTGRV